VTKAHDSIIIAGWENRALDLPVITSETLIRGVTATCKNWAPGLVYWLAKLYPPLPSKERPGSRPVSRDPAKGKAPMEPEPEPI
jgi:hypothetical protein